MALGNLTIDLLMRTGAFESSTKKAEKRLQELNREARQLGAAFGAAIAGGAAIATAAVKSSIDAMDEMGKSAMRAGMSSEQFSALAYAGSLADVAMQDLSSSMGRLAKAQADALKDSSAQGRIFDALGISIKGADGQLRSTTDVFADFADRFQQLKGSPEIVAAGMNIFGRSFQNLIPLMANGSQGLKDAADEAGKLNLIVSDDATKAAEQFNDNLTKIAGMATGLGHAVATNLLPDLVELTGRFIVSGTEGGKLNETADRLTGTIRALGGMFQFVYKPISAIGDLIEGLSVQVTGFYEAAAGLLTLDWGRMGKGWDLAEYGGQMAWQGSDAANAQSPEANTRKRQRSYYQEQMRKLEEEFAEQDRAAKSAEEIAARLQAIRDALAGNGSKGGTAAKATPFKDDLSMLDDFNAGMIETEARTLAWSRRLEDLSAEVSGPLAVAMLDYKRQIAEVDAAKRTGILTAGDAIEMERLLGDQYAKTAEAIKGPVDQMTVFAEQAARNMQDAFGDFLFDPFKDGLDGMLRGFSDILRRMAAEAAAAEAFKALGNYGQANGGTWWGALLGAFGGTKKAGGGYISGPGTATSDSIPALLSNGEYVIKADAVSQYGRGFFESLNARRFASGGYVGGGSALAFAGAAPQFNLNIHNAPPGTTASSSGNGSGGMDIDVIIGQMEKRMAGNMAQGASPFNSALESRYAVQKRV